MSDTITFTRTEVKAHEQTVENLRNEVSALNRTIAHLKMSSSKPESVAAVPDEVQMRIKGSTWRKVYGGKVRADYLVENHPGVYEVRELFASPPAPAREPLDVTPAMIKAAVPWLTGIHHMRATDKQNAIEQALIAAFKAIHPAKP